MEVEGHLDSYSLLLVISLMVVLSVLGIFRLRTRGTTKSREIDLNWLEEFSVAKYRPMQRMLLEADFAFLSAQPGYRPELGKMLRAERFRVFGAYLRALCKDFDRLHYAAKQAVLHSPEGVDLCGALARHRAVFHYALLQVRVRLVLYRLGLATVDVRPLIGALDEMMTDVRALRPAMQSSAAY